MEVILLQKLTESELRCNK